MSAMLRMNNWKFDLLANGRLRVAKTDRPQIRLPSGMVPGPEREYFSDELAADEVDRLRKLLNWEGEQTRLGEATKGIA